jgi:hypothetical protein
MAKILIVFFWVMTSCRQLLVFCHLPSYSGWECNHTLTFHRPYWISRTEDTLKMKQQVHLKFRWMPTRLHDVTIQMTSIFTICFQPTLSYFYNVNTIIKCHHSQCKHIIVLPITLSNSYFGVQFFLTLVLHHVRFVLELSTWQIAHVSAGRVLTVLILRCIINYWHSWCLLVFHVPKLTIWTTLN